LNFETKLPNEKQNKYYDFTKLKDLTNVSQADREKWYFDFIDLLHLGKTEIEQILNKESKDFNPNTLHDLLNYTTYFGADDLKNIIWALKQNGNSIESLISFDSEIKSLIVFYQNNHIILILQKINSSNFTFTFTLLPIDQVLLKCQQKNPTQSITALAWLYA